MRFIRTDTSEYQSFGGSFQGLLEQFQRRHTGEGTALQLVQMVTETFPSFRDETWLDGRRGISPYPSSHSAISCLLT